MKYLSVLMVCLALVKNAFPSEVTDFAPLGIGNVWVYSNEYSMFYSGITGETARSILTIRINSSEELGDTARFTAEVVDSTTAWYRYGGRNRVDLPPQVLRFTMAILDLPDGTIEVVPANSRGYEIRNPLLKLMFSRHGYDDSLVDTLPENQGFPSAKIEVPPESDSVWWREEAVYWKDVGLISCTTGVWPVKHVATLISYQSENGTSVGVLPNMTKSISKRAGPKAPGVWNLLGQRIPGAPENQSRSIRFQSNGSTVFNQSR